MDLYLIVVNQLVQRWELALTDAVHVAFYMDTEVLVATGSFKRNRKVTNLKIKYQRQCKLIIKNIEDKHSVNNQGLTPLDLAKKKIALLHTSVDSVKLSTFSST